jgi:tartrate-resistant acid phosphatase type 5
MHHAPYVSRAAGEGEVAMRWPYAAWGVTAILAGHNHFYERLRPPDGGLYFVNGLGGNNIYPIGDPMPGSEVRFGEDFGAMFVQANFERIIFRFVTRAGAEVDYIEVKKSSLTMEGG